MEPNFNKLQYPIQKIDVISAMDDINHFSCIPEDIRTSNEALGYYQEVLQRWMDEGNQIIPYDSFVEKFEQELGILDFVTHTHFLKETTIWTTYCKLKDEMILMGRKSGSTASDPLKTRVLDILMNITDQPSVDLNSCIDIWNTLKVVQQHLRKSLNHNEYNVDFAKDLYNFIFGSLLPYKYHAYGLLDKYSSLNKIFNTPVENFSTSYLELLVRMLFKEIQSIRGTSLTTTNTKLQNIILLGYFLLSILYRENLENTEISVLGDYLQLMISDGVSNYICEQIKELSKTPDKYLELVQKLEYNDEIQNIMHLHENFYKSGLDKPMKSSTSLDTSWGNWMITGNGFFSDQNLLLDNGKINETFLYGILNTNEDMIKKYLSCDAIRFQIPEEYLGYLKSEIQADICKLFNTDTGETRYLVTIPEGIFELFMVDDTHDVYGIGIVESPNHNRQIIKFGADKSEYRYKLAVGGEM